MVKWFDARRGFGFIVHTDGRDVFVHYSVIEGDGFRILKDHETVDYEFTEGPLGLLATRVERTARPAVTPPSPDAAQPLAAAPDPIVEAPPTPPATPAPPARPQPPRAKPPQPVWQHNGDVEVAEDPDDSVGNRREPGTPPANPDSLLRHIINANIPIKIRSSDPS